MRLIDADALDDAMYQEAFEKDTDMQKWDGGCWIRYKMFENKIKEAPTVNCLNEILEKIIAEIENDWQLKDSPSSPFSCGLRRAMEIIYKYKSESKGVEEF